MMNLAGQPYKLKDHKGTVQFTCKSPSGNFPDLEFSYHKNRNLIVIMEKLAVKISKKEYHEKLRATSALKEGSKNLASQKMLNFT